MSGAPNETENDACVPELGAKNYPYQACAHIIAGDNHGTGFLVSPIFVITCEHVIRSVGCDGKVRLGFTGSSSNVFGRVVKVDSKLDYALIKLDIRSRLQPLPLAKDWLIGKWEAFGFPKNADWKLVPLEGTIMLRDAPDDKGQPSVVLYSPNIGAGLGAKPGGFSGGPVLVRGAVVAFLTRIIPDVDDLNRAEYGLLFARAISTVSDLLPADEVHFVSPIGEFVAPSDEIECSTITDVCAMRLPAQLERVGRTKYLDDCYVERRVEKEIDGVLQLESRFPLLANGLIENLESIAKDYLFPRETVECLSRAKDALSSPFDQAEWQARLKTIKATFEFDRLARALSLLNGIIQESSDQVARRLFAEFANVVVGLNCVGQKKYPAFLVELRTLRAGFLANTDGYKIGQLHHARVLSYLPCTTVENRTETANDIISKLDNLICQVGGRCIAMVDRAGLGKTNLLCRLSRRFAQTSPIILLNGRRQMKTIIAA
jgi:hypothetical protein